MKRITSIAAIFICFLLLSPCAIAERTSPLIIDHTNTNLWLIPDSAITRARNTLHIAYGHTSHGSQLISGMGGQHEEEGSQGDELDHFMTNNGATPGLYIWNEGGSDGALDIDDYAMGGDVGDYPNWVTNTRNYLGDPDPDTGRGTLHSDVNVIIWSWCGEAADRTEETMRTTYLEPMSQFELDYPGITFVYMTGHLNGTGPDGNLNRRNEQIREYCRTNNKVLYDFADIESFDPDGQVNYMELNATDHCDYDSDGNGSRDRNWALDWQASHVEGVDWWASGASHSIHLNGNLKGYAAWWLWARLAGWGDCIEAPSDLNADADSLNQQIVLSWTDNSTDTDEDSFIIQRQMDGGTWDNDYHSVPANATTFTDSDLASGSYQYRVVAHLEDDGQGNPCDSGTSNVVEALIENTDPPAAPSDLSATPNSQNRRIDLSWTDNATNENGFRIQRRRGNGDWIADYAEVLENVHEFADAQLEPGEYSYRLLAFNDYGESAVTDSATAVILDLPEAPSELTALADSDNGTISLNWTDNADNETGYIIQRQVNDDTWDDLYDQTAANTSEYVDTNKDAGPLADGTYTYRVVAGNDNGRSDPSNEAQVVISTDDDTDSDGDGVPDSEDGCPEDRNKTAPGTCGCGTPDTDSDDDETPDCNDQCPDDPDKIDPGQCGCGVPETDSCNLRPRPPELIAPADASTDTSLTPSLNAGDFQDPDSEDTHGQTIWQISTNRDFSELAVNETSDAHLVAFTVPQPLAEETTYYWRVCYIDNRSAQSEWSDPFSFTTAAQDPLSDETPEDEDDTNDDGNGSDGDGFPGCFIGVADRKR